MERSGSDSHLSRIDPDYRILSTAAVIGMGLCGAVWCAACRLINGNLESWQGGWDSLISVHPPSSNPSELSQPQMPNVIIPSVTEPPSTPAA